MIRLDTQDGYPCGFKSIQFMLEKQISGAFFVDGKQILSDVVVFSFFLVVLPPSFSLSRIKRSVPFQFGAQGVGLVVDQLVEQCPEAGAVVHLHGVAQLVEDDIVDQVLG
jgi:hypothetical protein